MRIATIFSKAKNRITNAKLAWCSFLAVAVILFGLCDAASAELSGTAVQLQNQSRMVERAIAGRFEPLPMRIIGRARGGHLEDFGVVFLLEVNVVPMANLSPFRQPYSEAEIKNLNRKKQLGIEQLEEIGLDLLKNAAGSLSAISTNENIALIIALFHFTWEDTTKLPSQLVLQAQRKILLDYAAGRISEFELRRELKIRRF